MLTTDDVDEMTVAVADSQTIGRLLRRLLISRNVERRRATPGTRLKPQRHQRETARSRHVVRRRAVKGEHQVCVQHAVARPITVPLGFILRSASTTKSRYSLKAPVLWSYHPPTIR